MVWRSIIIIACHLAVALLVWSGYSWISEGIGINPYLSWTGAAMLYSLCNHWIVSQAEEADVKIQDYLEYLDRSKDKLHNMPIYEGEEDEAAAMCAIFDHINNTAKSIFK